MPFLRPPTLRRPSSASPSGPCEVRAWRRDPKTRRLRRVDPDPEGRLRSRTTGLLVGTGENGWGLRIWDAATGERLRSPEEEEARARRMAEERAEQEAAARREAEARGRELAAEIERLRERGREAAEEGP